MKLYTDNPHSHIMSLNPSWTQKDEHGWRTTARVRYSTLLGHLGYTTDELNLDLIEKNVLSCTQERGVHA